jgi:hypothetical protein
MSTQSEYQPAYFLVSDLVDLLGRKMYTWEHDMLFIMRLTHSDHWIGATRNSKYEPNGRTYFGRYGVQRIEWQMVHQDNLLSCPGVYRVDGDKENRLFVNFIGRRRYEFPLFTELEGNEILKEVFKGSSYTDAIEIVSQVPMKALDERMWKELKILPV